MKLFKIALLSILLSSCTTRKDSLSIKDKQSLAELTVDIIRNNDVDRVHEMVMQERHFTALYEYELKNSPQEVSKKDLVKLAKHKSQRALRKAKKSLRKLYAKTKKLGLDLSKARLSSVELRDGQKFSENSKLTEVDLYLLIEFGSETIRIKLDDCFYQLHERKLADGFKIVK